MTIDLVGPAIQAEHAAALVNSSPAETSSRWDNPSDAIWPNRDRFVLSNGHASMLLWSVLHLTGVQAVNADYETVGKPAGTLDDIRRFRQLGSKAPGHPEYRFVSGVETTTGPAMPTLVAMPWPSERSEGAVIADKAGDTACIFLAGLYRVEQAIADRLVRIVKGGLPSPWIDDEKALPWIEKRSGLARVRGQRSVWRGAGDHRWAGRRQDDDRQFDPKDPCGQGRAAAALRPDGPRAKRMTEATGVEAKTIHRLLEVDPRSGGFKRNADNPLDCDLLVVDEASMVDVMLMQALMKATPDNAAQTARAFRMAT